MNLKRLLHGKYSPYILAVILGLGLACVFRHSCKDKKCIVFKGPALDKVQDQVFKYDDKCYKFNAQAADCNDNSGKKTIEFA